MCSITIKDKTCNKICDLCTGDGAMAYALTVTYLIILLSLSISGLVVVPKDAPSTFLLFLLLVIFTGVAVLSVLITGIISCCSILRRHAEIEENKENIAYEEIAMATYSEA